MFMKAKSKIQWYFESDQDKGQCALENKRKHAHYDQAQSLC